MIILSCGCQSDEFGIEAEWDTFSREGKPAIECGFICQKHFEIYDARTPEPEAKLKEKSLSVWIWKWPIYAMRRTCSS
jgi:hypothetical protein